MHKIELNYLVIDERKPKDGNTMSSPGQGRMMVIRERVKLNFHTTQEKETGKEEWERVQISDRKVKLIEHEKLPLPSFSLSLPFPSSESFG